MINYHKWEEYTNLGISGISKKHKDKLPPGRWLRIEEKIRDTDLICWTDSRRNRVKPNNKGPWIKAGDFVQDRHFIYRPKTKKS